MSVMQWAFNGTKFEKGTGNRMQLFLKLDNNVEIGLTTWNNDTIMTHKDADGKITATEFASPDDLRKLLNRLHKQQQHRRSTEFIRRGALED